ncbi:sirohydrochlorin chelatase [Mycoplasma sp. P36-A1]|uniref:sirohydrochlorin chelatase n=1 Tax=Mycoplasma sp. P36-A1 TaxID=3252900 RepID=UPI003C2CD407
MKGILILAHGSRRNKTVESMNDMMNMIKERNKDVAIENAFMELASPLLAEGLNNLVAKGINDIVIVPYFLFEGVHIKSDIPQEIAEYIKQNPTVNVTLGSTLGTDPRLADIITERIKAVL